MANTNSSKAKAKVTSEKEVENKTETKVVKEEPAKTGPSYDELLSLVKALSDQVNELKATKVPDPVETKTDRTGELINILTNRKSDKEVVIVHNCELLSGLTTHIELSNLIMDLRTMGEERTLSWSQFEELVSKYRSFFERGIIKVGSGYSDIAKRYNVPCVDDMNTYRLTTYDIERLPALTVNELETFIGKLSDEDKSTVFSYFLGKCYEKVPGFYDRYKMEALGRLCGRDAFVPLITIMNSERTD